MNEINEAQKIEDEVLRKIELSPLNKFINEELMRDTYDATKSSEKDSK